VSDAGAGDPLERVVDLGKAHRRASARERAALGELKAAVAEAAEAGASPTALAAASGLSRPTIYAVLRGADRT
jgi:hypothetical protein